MRLDGPHGCVCADDRGQRLACSGPADDDGRGAVGTRWPPSGEPPVQASPGAIWTCSVKMDASNRAASVSATCGSVSSARSVVPPQHPHVAHHPSLRRQVRGIAPLPHLERCNVVRQDAVQERHRVSPRHAQPAARAALPDGGSRTGGVVAGVIVAVSWNQSRRSFAMSLRLPGIPEACTVGTSAADSAASFAHVHGQSSTFALGILHLCILLVHPGRIVSSCAVMPVHRGPLLCSTRCRIHALILESAAPSRSRAWAWPCSRGWLARSPRRLLSAARVRERHEAGRSGEHGPAHGGGVDHHLDRPAVPAARPRHPAHVDPIRARTGRRSASTSTPCRAESALAINTTVTGIQRRE